MRAGRMTELRHVACNYKLAVRVGNLAAAGYGVIGKDCSYLETPPTPSPSPTASSTFPPEPIFQRVIRIIDVPAGAHLPTSHPDPWDDSSEDGLRRERR